MPLPTEEERFLILKALTRKMPLSKEFSWEDIKCNPKLEGFSGADLSCLVKEAGLRAILGNKEEIGNEEFSYALEKIKPSLDAKEKEKY